MPTYRSLGLWNVGVVVLGMLGCQAEPAFSPPSSAVPPSLAGSVATSAAVVPSTRHAGTEHAGTGFVIESAQPLGSADFGESRTATFVVRNVAATPRVLQLVGKSCTCTAVELPSAAIPPGGTGQVRITWSPHFRQVETTENLRVRVWVDVAGSPEEPPLRLEAVGQIAPRLMLYLPRGRLDFGQLDLADLKAGKDAILEILARSSIPSEPPHLSTSHPSLEVTLLGSLPPERLALLQARAGWRYRIRARFGLPVGAWQETLRVHSPLYSEPLEASIEGRVVSGAVSMTPEVIDLGSAALSISRGYRCSPVRITMRFEENRTLQVQRVEPAFFQAEVRRRPDRNNEWELYVRLPGGDQLRQLLSAAQLEELFTVGFEGGSVVLSSDHSLAPMIHVPISPGRLRP